MQKRSAEASPQVDSGRLYRPFTTSIKLANLRVFTLFLNFVINRTSSIRSLCHKIPSCRALAAHPRLASPLLRMSGKTRFSVKPLGFFKGQ